MTRRKGEYKPVFQPPEDIDPAVAEILQDRERHFRELRLSPEERKKLRQMREREQRRKQRESVKIKQRRKNRLTVDLPADLRGTIGDIATTEGVTISQVITFFLYDAVDRFKRQEISFWGHKYPSQSRRYDWNLIHPLDKERIGLIGRENHKNAIND